VKLSPNVRTVAAVLVVVFLLTTVWAAYYLYSETRSSTNGSGQAVAATYFQNADNGFTASLRPSVLYNNSTEISGGNTTLFEPITKWVNVTLVYSVLANRTAAIVLHEAFTVWLSTAVWSKSLYESSNNSSNAAAAGISLREVYDVNVGSVVALATAIDTQVGYNGAEYTLTLDPVITGTLTMSGVTQPFSSDPRFNLTFDGPLITPAGLAYATNGSVYVASPSSPSTLTHQVVPYLFLAASAAALGVSAWLVSRPLREEGIVPLDQLIAPYEEAIAETAAPPTDVTAVPIAQFADLVKIADTLGKPILRPAGGSPERPTFLVVDGTVAYSFRYPGGSSTTLGILERIQWEMIRLRSLTLDDATSADARQRLSRAIDFLRDDEEKQATQELNSVSALLTAAAKGAAEPPPPGTRPS